MKIDEAKQPKEPEPDRLNRRKGKREGGKIRLELRETPVSPET